MGQKVITGRRSKATVAERRSCRSLVDGTATLLAEVREAILDEVASEADDGGDALTASIEKKRELWKKMEAGDVDALVEMSILSGIMTEEDKLEFFT